MEVFPVRIVFTVCCNIRKPTPVPVFNMTTYETPSRLQQVIDDGVNKHFTVTYVLRIEDPSDDDEIKLLCPSQCREFEEGMLQELNMRDSLLPGRMRWIWE